MNKKGVFFIVPLIVCLLTGCDTFDDGQKQFDAARAAALQADDPFQALTTFEQTAGDYGKRCGLSLSDGQLEACQHRKDAEAQILLAAVEKGSVPALTLLFFSGSKSPDVSPRDLDEQKTTQLAGQLIALAEKAPADKASQMLLMAAAEVLQTGRYALQDSQKAIGLYIRAWQAGSQQAAKELVSVYWYLKDYRHAYFWEIRGRDFSKDSRAKLTHDEINDIQQRAADTRRPNL